MPKFTYISRDSKGQRVTAVAEAPTRQDLLGRLKTQGLTVIEVKELAAGDPDAAWHRGAPDVPRGVDAGAPRRRSITDSASTGEMAIFWREFATMIGAGLPVVEALESITQELEHKKLHRVLTDVTAGIWEGLSFSQSIARRPKAFSPMVIALMSAAEESGSMAKVSNQLADYLENRDRLIRKVQAALTYPIFLVGFFVVVMGIATFWIIPKFREIYTGFGAKLPRLTEITFAINAFVLAHAPLIIGAAAGAALLIALWAARPAGRKVVDGWALKLPIFGALLQRASVARFCRSLAVLLSGGIPINRALEMAQHTAGNAVVAQAIADSREEILKGSKIASSLKKHRHVFPQMAIRMIAAGEETGSLGGLLEKTADFYESRVDAALTTINALIEPVMIVVVGAFVLFFVLSMYMPIFSLAATMRG